VEFEESREQKEKKHTEHLSTQDTRDMYKDIEKELTDLMSQWKELIKAEKVAMEEGQWSKHAEPRIEKRKAIKKRDSATMNVEPKQITRLKCKLDNKSESENEELAVKQRKKSVKIEVPVALVAIRKERLIN